MSFATRIVGDTPKRGHLGGNVQSISELSSSIVRHFFELMKSHLRSPGVQIEMIVKEAQ